MEIFNFILIAYTVIGAAIFQWIDESIANEPWHEAIFFTFSTITTIGYGRVVPKSTPSKIFCIFYIFFGVPLAFFVLSNLGRKLGCFFWRIRAVGRCQRATITVDGRYRIAYSSFVARRVHFLCLDRSSQLCRWLIF